MSYTTKSGLWRDEEGIAVSAEYILLLGVSMLIFTAAFTGFSCFLGTASSDATSEAAYRLAAYLGGRMSDAIEAGTTSDTGLDLPARICGHSYIVFPSRGGRAICVLIDGERYEAPAILPAGVRVEGFMVSLPASHSIRYDESSKTITIS
jgi:hypothetical protein